MFPMHVDQSFGPCPFMQIVDVLRDNQQISVPGRIQPGKRLMRGVRLRLLDVFAPHVVKPQNQIGIARKTFGCRHVLDAMPLPQAACAAESVDPAFGRNAGTRQDYDVADVVHTHAIW